MASTATRIPTWAVFALILTATPALVAETDPESSDPGTVAEAEIVPIGVLDAQLRPMTLDQVEEELAIWMKLLQEKCVEVSDVEIRIMDLEGEDSPPDSAKELVTATEEAVQLRAERAHLIERVRAVIESVRTKGGDVDVSNAYVNSVVVSPPVAGWRAAATTVRAWVTSKEGGGALLNDLGIAIGILFGAWVIAKILGRVVSRLLSNTERVSELLRNFSVTAVRRATLFFGLLLALSELGLNMGPLLATIGALGLVVGLALQSTLSNFASGLMIMIYRPFDVGDSMSTGGHLGSVEGMTLVTTTIKTFDNKRLSIPNNMIWGDVITNLTAEDTRRVDMTFGIGYGDDIEQAKQILLEILSQHEKVLKDPAINVQLHELADSSVNFIARPWVKTVDYWDVYWDVQQQVKERFDAEGISIPYPQSDMHIHYATETSPVASATQPVFEPERDTPNDAPPASDSSGDD